MATNFYFNNFPSRLADAPITPEQLLVENLVIEALQIYGLDVYYLPRTTRDEVDYLFGEDSLKQYLTAHAIEMYLENVTGFDGEQDFISKFGLEIRDEVTMLVSRLRFRYTVNGYTRPREGDLIYVPMTTSFFEITIVEHENDQAMFYTLGRGRGGNVYVYAIKLKQFVFSDEIIDTGFEEIDVQVFDAYRRTRIPFADNGQGNYVSGEIVYQGTDLANATAQAIVHSQNLIGNNYIDVIRMNGTFSTGNTLIGVTSNARYIMSATEDGLAPFDDSDLQDAVDNNAIEREGFDFIDFTEVNPFGEP